MFNEWDSFIKGKWDKEIEVSDFIKKNYTPYLGNEDYLEGASDSTEKLWNEVLKLMELERKNGIYDADESLVSTIISHDAGYISKELEKIVGLQTDKPLKRAIMPFGGIRMVEKALDSYGYSLDPYTKKIFTEYRKTHNDAVYDIYTDEMRMARRSGIITGLPDSYGRGRIVGDYRRIALYGVDYLIENKEKLKKEFKYEYMKSPVLRTMEEVAEQIKALKELKKLAEIYGFDISKPAKDAQEAIQWTYFGYLAAIKEQNGAAMSLGRVSTFFDIYIENDIKKGIINEKEAQELIDHFVMKLRLVRFLRAPEYNQLFSGDPAWVTESLAGMGTDNRTMVTKTTYRFLNTLYNLGSAPEPNLTVLWSKDLPEPFKKYCAKVSIDTSAIQYENDDLMRPIYEDDYGIACCVSVMKIGKQMQFFGARANLAKALLYAINGGKDEVSFEQVGPEFPAIKSEYLDYDEVMEKFEYIMEWLAKLYILTLNLIHYMHDRYSYERVQMALHDHNITKTAACGIAGLSVVVDSLSAIKYAKVKTIRNEQGLVVDYEIEGEYPAFGNNDDKVDQIAVDVVKKFMNKLRKYRAYKSSIPTLSILTITSNVVYGKKTGNTPDGRKKGEPFAPGANPMHGRDKKGALASMMSVAKIPYEYSEDGISYTFSIVPKALGKLNVEKRSNLAGLIDGYFAENGQHINVNVFDRETLIDAMKKPEKYPQLTIRVSGYAVNFVKLTKEQQLDVINRTFHNRY